MRRVILPFAGAFVLGILSYSIGICVLYGAVITALFLITAFRRKLSIIVILIVFFMLGYYTIEIWNMNKGNIYTQLKGAEAFEGIVEEKKGESITVANYHNSYRVVAFIKGCSPVVPGDYVQISGVINEKKEYSIRYMNACRIDAYATCQSYNVIIKDRFSIRAVPIKIRYRLSSALESIHPSGGAFISGLVTGQTSGISEEHIKAFSDTGLSHILAVSGFNLAIIFYTVLSVGRKLPKKTRYAVCMAVCLGYVLITGFEPSVTRAFVMLSMSAAGVFLNRDYDAITGITITALAMLVFNPFYIYNSGFQLSFAATLGIVLLKEDIKDRMPKVFERGKDDISVAFAAFIATLPLIIYSKGYFSLSTVLFNILIAPFISIITVLSFICSFLFLIFNFEVILYPCVAAGAIIVRLVNAAEGINLMCFPGSPSMWFVILYYAFVLMCFGYIRIPPCYSFKIKLASSIVLIALLLFKIPALEIHIINVGQGDSMFIETPNGKTILIDTGPSYGDYTAAQSKVVPYVRKQGYNKIDMMIITHYHSDHAGGMDYIFKNMAVGALAAFQMPEENIDIPFIELKAGDTVSIGGMELCVLFPEKGEYTHDENETCLVMELIYGQYNMLLTADAESNVMDMLSGEYDVLKLPHHGSETSFSYNMAAASHIKSAVVSVGKNNYGHPSQKVLKYLKDRGINTYRTDTMGNIKIMVLGKSYRIISQSD